jgi:hypothetical protein
MKINEMISEYNKLNEDLEQTIVDASANVGCGDMVDILLGVVSNHVDAAVLEEIKKEYEAKLQAEA